MRKGDVTALEDVDLEVSAGEFVSIIGPSGCGKSSLLYIMGGLRPADAGEVRLAGKVVDGPIPERVAFVFQDYTLFPWRTVLANVDFGLEIRGVRKDVRRAKAMECLALTGLADFATSYPSELSGGMQQRVALARALSLEPDVLLMDEPFGALDEQTRMTLGEELSEIVAKAAVTTVFVTHSLAEAVYLADRVVVMSARPGRIKETIVVPEQRPRSADYMGSEEFGRIRSRLFQSLREEMKAVSADGRRTVG